jgi:hypothetical protein
MIEDQKSRGDRPWILRDAVVDVDLDVKKAFKGFLF